MEQRFCCIDPLILKMKINLTSPHSREVVSLYCKDIRHQKFKTLISEPHLGAEWLMRQLQVQGQRQGVTFFFFYLQICPEAHFPLLCRLPLFLWVKRSEHECNHALLLHWLRICGFLFPHPRIFKPWVLERARSTCKSQATCCLWRCLKWRSFFKTFIWQSRDKTPKYFGNLRAACYGDIHYAIN